MNITTPRLLRLIVTALLVTGLVACGDDDDVTGNDDEQNQQQDENKDDKNNDDDENDDNGNDDEDDLIDPDDQDIVIAGSWETNFDGREDIDDDQWTFVFDENDDLVQAMIDFDNDERWAITQNPEDAEFGPGSYNRSVWTDLEDDRFYYCTVDFGLESEEDAHASEQKADEEDLEGGCGEGSPWTEMTRL